MSTHRRQPRDERGDTLVEVLVAVLIVGLTAVSLIGAFLISIAGSAVHRNVVTSDTLLRSFASRALYQIQLQPSPTFTTCATPTTYKVVMAYPGNAAQGSTVQVYGSGFTPGKAVGISIGGLSVTSNITKGATVDANGAVASTLVLPPGVQIGADALAVSDGTFTGTGSIVVTSDPAVATASLNYAIHISNVQYWNGSAFTSSCVLGGAAPQLLTATAITPRGITDQISFVVANAGCVSSTSPAFASATSTSFGVGQAGKFTVRACGTPAPTITESGALPSGVTFNGGSGGIATLAGTPAAGSAGSYPITFTATNGIAPDAVQHFTLAVGTAPTITSAASKTATAGTAFSFQVTTTGIPTPTITEAGTLPAGVTFVDNGNGTASLSGTPGVSTGGTYPLTIAASNGVVPGASQAFTLTINQPPLFTSAAAATFSEGVAGSFTITTSANPTAGIFRAGALPSGVSLVDNGDGTATLAGTPAVGSGGSYALTLTANNGTAPAGTQSFTLSVQGPPSFTSAASYAAVAGTAFTFTITTAGIPAASITRTGTLPSGVSFTNNGNGTATLSGTPGANQGGTYPLTFKASNGFAPDATQSFTLKVNQAPAITSAASATFQVGSSGSFTVTTTGIPTAAITKSGSLPSGVGLVDNGNGTATISGTPAAGTSGTYAITITASNGVAPNATQAFTLKVNGPPKITSANSYHATANVLFTFTVTTSGYPVATISIAGALPSGVSFVNNGNGTGTLSGKPKKNTSGSVVVTFTASNGFAPNYVQSFTFSWS
jgi:hypothetical protein